MQPHRIHKTPGWIQGDLLRAPANTNNDSTQNKEEKTTVQCIEKSKKLSWTNVAVEQALHWSSLYQEANKRQSRCDMTQMWL